MGLFLKDITDRDQSHEAGRPGKRPIGASVHTSNAVEEGVDTLGHSINASFLVDLHRYACQCDMCPAAI